MKKIIQIQSDSGELHCLTEDGKIYVYKSYKKQICDGNQYKEETKWVTGYKWIEVEEFEREYIQPIALPF